MHSNTSTPTTLTRFFLLSSSCFSPHPHIVTPPPCLVKVYWIFRPWRFPPSVFFPLFYWIVARFFSLVFHLSTRFPPSVSVVRGTRMFAHKQYSMSVFRFPARCGPEGSGCATSGHSTVTSDPWCRLLPRFAYTL